MPTKAETFSLGHYQRLDHFRFEETLRLLADLREAGLTKLTAVSVHGLTGGKDIGFVFRRHDNAIGVCWFTPRAVKPRFFFYMPGCKSVRASRRECDKAVLYMENNTLISLEDNEQGTQGYVRNLEWRPW